MKFDTGTELPDNFVLTKEFSDVYNLINDTNVNLFITGKAGSGKSTLLEYFRQNTNKNFVTLAFQGITAIKAKGQTLHSFFKFGPHFLAKEEIKLIKKHYDKLNLLTIMKIARMINRGLPENIGIHKKHLITELETSIIAAKARDIMVDDSKKEDDSKIEGGEDK